MRSIAALALVLLFSSSGLAAVDACAAVPTVEVVAALRGPGTVKIFRNKPENPHLLTCVFKRLSHPLADQANFDAVKNESGPLLSVMLGDEEMVKENTFATQSGTSDAELQGLGERSVLRRGANFVAVVVWTRGQVLRIALASANSKTQADDVQDLAREAVSGNATKGVAYFPVTERAFSSDRDTLAPNLGDVCAILFQSNFVASATPYCEEGVKQNPKDSAVRLMLAAVYARQSMLTRDLAQRLSLIDKAIAECERATRDDPQTLSGIKELAGFSMYRAFETPNGEERFRALERSREYLLDVLKADPKDAQAYLAYYGIAVVDWMEVYKTRTDAKSLTGILPEAPIEDKSLCSDLQTKNQNKVNEAINNLNKALELRSDDDAAMAYLHLAYREKADLECGNPEARKQDLAEAEDWIRKTVLARRAKMAQNRLTQSDKLADSPAQNPWVFPPPPTLAPPPPPPPGVVPMGMVGQDGKPFQGGVLGGIVGSALPPPKTSGQGVQPVLVRVSSGVVAGNKISGPDPEYPPLARTARIQGTVVLKATISRTGEIESLSAISGPPMLLQAAIDAVQQWRYRPYVLNGEVVEVETTIQVNFTLSGDTPNPQE